MRWVAVSLVTLLCISTIPVTTAGGNGVHWNGYVLDRNSIPNRVLIDQNAEPYSLHTGNADVIVVAFIFTTCVDVCPVITNNLIEAERDMQLLIMNDLKANNAKITKAKYSATVSIYDFAINLKEEIKGGKIETINETIVGIQVKLINNENTQYVVGSGQGRASTIGTGFLKNPNMDWNQSSLSSASNKAMETAVVNVIKAIDRRSW